MILLDTDHITLLQRAGPLGDKIRARLHLLALADHPPTTIITYEEQIRGWTAELARAKTLATQIEVYDRLRATLNYFSATEIADFDIAAATIYQQLIKRKIRIGTMDLKIAAIALSRGDTLWTRNATDYAKVPDLHILDATR